MKNRLLTIVIPTYNRASLLDITLKNLINTVRYLKLEIIVSDNASPDNTESVVTAHMKDYSELKYNRQPINVGYDRNVITCYQHATSNYIWILGDSYSIIKEQVENVILRLEEGIYHGIVMNSFDRIKNIPSKVYNDPSKLLSDLGWHMTFLNSFIISREFIKNEFMERYCNTYYLHLGLFFENVVLYKSLQIYWISDNVISATVFDERMGNLRKGGWQDILFEVFGTHWFALIMSLPNQINIDSKLKCIKDHDENTHIFAIRRLLRFRTHDAIKREDFEKNKIFISFYTNVPIWKLKLLFYIPIPVLKFSKSIYFKIRK